MAGTPTFAISTISLAGFRGCNFRNATRRVAGLLAWMIALLAVPAAAQAQSVGGAVLLQNDRLIEGKVVPSGDFYSIQVAEQSRVSIPKSEVLHVADDKLGIYHFKHASVKRWEAGDHFQMTRWCMLNGLYAQASEHYREVADLHGDHPRIRQLALELQNRLLKIPDFRQYLGLEAEPSNSPLHAGDYADNSQPQLAAGVRANGAQANRDKVVPAGVGRSSATAAAMHPQIAAHFARRIQPILLNRCSQPACHGAQSNNGLRIVEPYRAAYERVSSDNLRSVLTQISMHSGELSPLLQYATTAHGIQRQAGVSITETQLLTELTNWIQFVQNPVAAAVAESGPVRNSPAGGRVPAPSGFVPFSPATALVPVQPGASGLRPVPSDLEANSLKANPTQFPNGDIPLSSEIDALDRQLQQILGETGSPRSVASPTVSPRASQSVNPATRGALPTNRPGQNGIDPFDPAAFNQQTRRQSDN